MTEPVGLSDLVGTLDSVSIIRNLRKLQERVEALEKARCWRALNMDIIGTIGRRRKKTSILLGTQSREFFAIVPLEINRGESIGEAWKRQLRQLSRKLLEGK